MNILPKSLAIAFLVVSIFISGINVDFAGAQNTSAGTAASLRISYRAGISDSAGSLPKMDSQVIKHGELSRISTALCGLPQLMD